MGDFAIRVCQDGRTVKRFTAPNALHFEGAERFYRQMFPPIQAPMNFQIGISAPTLLTKSTRPNPVASTSPEYSERLTLDQFQNANEGGAYTGSMRYAMGYSRQGVGFTAGIESLGGFAVSSEAHFSNEQTWARHPGNWDDPETLDVQEPTPPPWDTPPWEGNHGYPWQVPRVRSDWLQNWDPTTEIDWLTDFRKMGGFPILNAFLVDANTDTLIASSLFRAPVLMRPGLSLYVQYRARLTLLSRAFAGRFAERAFTGAGDLYDAFFARPLLSTAGTPRAAWTWEDVEPHFSPVLAAEEIEEWSFVPYSPPGDPPPPAEIIPHLISDIVPQWINETADDIGVIDWIVVYGEIGGEFEPLWYVPVEPGVILAENDRLRIPNRLIFRVRGI